MNVQTIPCPNVSFGGYTTYYFDSRFGNDSNDGLDPAAPKQSLESLNALVSSLRSGVRILVARGSRYEGTLSLVGFRAEEDRPLYAGVYGEGAAPVIDGNGNDCAVEIGRGNLIFEDFEITNAKGLIGIFVNVKEAGTLSSLVIRNCSIHDVNWNWTEPLPPQQTRLERIDVEQVCPRARYYYETGGIVFLANSPVEKGPCNYENIWILHNRLERISRSGILLTGLWNRRPGTPWGVNAYYSDANGWYPSRKIEISDNEVYYSGGDGIVLIGSVDSCIEGNVSYHSNYLGRTDTANAGIWPIGCKRILIQYNEAAYSHLEHGGADGEGFDIDIANEDILFRYNYAHDNDGGAILLCNARTVQPSFDENGNPVIGRDGAQAEYSAHGLWRNVTIRDCVAIDNGKAPEHPNFIHFSSTCKHLNVLRNTVIMRSDLRGQLVIRTADYANCGKQERLYFADNYFGASAPTECGFDMSFAEDFVFENNVYCNLGESAPVQTGDRSPQYACDAPTVPNGKDGFGAALEIVRGVGKKRFGRYGAQIER